MKIEIEQKNLIDALSKVIGVIEKRNTIPILSNVVLKAEDGVLIVRGTDLDVEVVSKVVADIVDDGECAVSAALLQSIVRKLPKGNIIVLASDNDNLEVKSGRSSFNLSTLPVSDFPDIATHEYESSFTIPADDLIHIFDSTMFAMSSEETRYYLNGIYLHPFDGKVRAVATDGHRLAVADYCSAIEFPGVIIPRKTVIELRKIVDSTGCDVNVEVSEYKIRLTVGDSQVTSKVIDGTFPDYARVIPTANDKRLAVDANDVKAASDRVSQVATEKTRLVKLSIKDDVLDFEVKGENNNVANDSVTCHYRSEPIEIGMNAKYLAECLAACGSGEVEIFLSTPNDAITVRSKDDDNVLFVVMPMRV